METSIYSKGPKWMPNRHVRVQAATGDELLMALQLAVGEEKFVAFRVLQARQVADPEARTRCETCKQRPWRREHDPEERLWIESDVLWLVTGRGDKKHEDGLCSPFLIDQPLVAPLSARDVVPMVQAFLKGAKSPQPDMDGSTSQGGWVLECPESAWDGGAVRIRHVWREFHK